MHYTTVLAATALSAAVVAAPSPAVADHTPTPAPSVTVNRHNVVQSSTLPRCVPARW